MQGGRHRCRWPGCTRAIARRLWACPDHFKRLPADIRARLARVPRWIQPERRNAEREAAAAARRIERESRDLFAPPVSTREKQ